MGFIRAFVMFVVLGFSPVYGGESSPLKKLQTGSDSRGWEAVGRLNFGGRAFCTGALIAPDLVLTAAHCLFEKGSGRQYGAGEIEFLAGWRNGRANAKARVRRAIAHPNFEYQQDNRVTRVAYDLALLQLERPIRKLSITPFATEVRPRKGAEVGVVSYGRGRADSPSLQEVCYVLARRSGTLVLSCEADFGSSGAPIFTLDDEGKARIVSVISAKAEISGRNVSLGTRLEKPLADLQALMANAKDAPEQEQKEQQVSGVRVLKLGGAGSGAKFVRP